MKKADKALYKKAIGQWGGKAQMQMCIEECSELIKALCKLDRAKNDKERIAAYESILEETVDVQIMTEQIVTLFGGNGLAIKNYRAAKLNRLKKLLTK